MEFRIRSAGIADLEHVSHHRRAMFEEMGFRDPGLLALIAERSTSYFSRALRDATYKGWLAENSNGWIVGGGGIVIAPWPGCPCENLAERAWILNRYTEPGSRRQGVAKRLLRVMIDWSRQRGFGAVSLHASPAGRPLYGSASFQQSNEMTLTLR